MGDYSLVAAGNVAGAVVLLLLAVVVAVVLLGNYSDRYSQRK